MTTIDYAQVDAILAGPKPTGDGDLFKLSPEARIARLEHLRTIARDCVACQNEWYPALIAGRYPFAPSHGPNAYCRSGRRPHCTCDGCF